MEYNFSNVLLILLVKYFYNRLRFNVFIDKSCKGTLFSITVYISEASITESKLTSTPLVCFLGCRKWALKRREAFIGIFLIIFKQSQLQMCCLSKLNSCVVVCSDDEHSNCPPERHRHVSIVLHAVADCHWCGRHSYVARQQLRPVRLSHMAHASPGLGYNDHVDLRNPHHCSRTLHRCHLSSVVQCKNELDVGN